MSDVRRGHVVAIVAMAVVGLTAGACGSSTTDAGSTPSTTSGTTVPAAVPSGTVPAPGTSAPGTTAVAAAPAIVVISTPYGDALGTDDGLVLYAWDEEADGTIACVAAECLEKWPPLLTTEPGTAADLDPARLTLVARTDGTTQVALDGKPLYHMAVDEPGEANCQGAEGWWILNPDGTKNTNETKRS